MSLLLAALLLAQNTPAPGSSYSEEVKANLERIFRSLDSPEASLRDLARRDLKNLVEAQGEAFLTFARERAEHSSNEVRLSLEDLVHYRERVREARKTLAAFDVLDTPDLKGKRFVIYNTGLWSQSASGFEFRYTYGWLLDESKDSIRLADETPDCGTCSKILPEWLKAPEATPPKGAPLPAAYGEVDFDLFCRELIKNGSTPSTHPYAKRESSTLINEAVYAYWAFKVGREDLGLQLLAQAQKTFEGPHNDWVKHKTSLRQLIECFMVQHLRAAAIEAAAGGEVRSKVLDRWRTIALRLPEDEYPGEAKEMCEQYEIMVREDASWKEPGKEELSSLPVDKKVAYWIYHLRDVAARQWSDPGEVDIIKSPFGMEERKDSYPPNELVKLGWDAIPLLIEHLDDRRPSRSIGWHRMFLPGTYYLLRMGDCCVQVLTAISGESFYDRRSTSGAMVKDGEAPATKEKALRWWAEKKQGGAENYFIQALGKPELATTAAEKLLAMDKAKHLPRLLLILEHGSRGCRNAVLVPLAPHLEREQEKLVEAVLGDSDAQVMVAAARILWDKWRSERGMLEVIGKLRAIAPEDRQSQILWFSKSLFWSIRTENVAKGLAELMKSQNMDVRLDAIRNSARFPHPLLAASLVAELGNKTLTGWSGPFALRYCDEAAWALIAIAHLSERFKLEGSEPERDRTITALREWWKTDGATVDWSAHFRDLETSKKEVRK